MNRCGTQWWCRELPGWNHGQSPTQLPHECNGDEGHLLAHRCPCGATQEVAA